MKNAIAEMLKLREYREDDFEQLWELDQRCFPAGIAYSRRELAYYLRSKKAICQVATEDKGIVGFIVGHHDRRGFGHVVTLDVDISTRRAGLGSALMHALETSFREADCTSTFLEVAVNNIPAISFYKKHGYSVLKTLPRYYHGELDGLLMGKRIDDQRPVSPLSGVESADQ